MKYIRTKDGIFEVEKLNLDKIVGTIQYHILDNSLIKRMYGSETHMYKYKILAQADTIEELCDMTIVVDDERPNDIFELEWGIDKELLRKYNDVKGVYVYGAVWCEWGLKYVAKLNDKGELVLI